jgi:NADPH2:quinone reductase
VRALEIQRLDGPDGVVAAERPEPDADGRVLIDVHAAGVSFPDLLISQGRYQVKAALPWVPGQEVAGVVRSAPAGHALAPGARVWASLDALGVNFLTAVFALRRRGALQDGEDVLVLGAAGGLGSATVAVAKAMGARVIAAVSTEDKVATARAAGADEVVVGEPWRDAVLDLTGGRGAGLVADVVGGEQTLQAVRSTAPGGRVLVLGFTAGTIPEIATNRLLLRNVSLVGAGLGAFLPADPQILERCAADVLALVAAGLRPIVGATYPLERGADALRALADRSARGKLVLTVR